MLTAVKNEFKVIKLTIKYSLIREMLNKTSFISNVLFMILNNASFLIQWFILLNIREDIGGYTMKSIILLWGIGSGTYGIAHFFFKNSFSLSDIINNGKLDAFLVQPKNIYLSVLTNQIEVSGLGDLIYSYIMLFIYGFTIKNFILYTLFIILGGLMIMSLSTIFNSLAFWIGSSDLIADTYNQMIIFPATYPEGIFKGIIKILIYTLIPVGIINYIPIKYLTTFNPILLLISILSTIIITLISYIIFNIGLKKYSSSNLLSGRI